MKLTTSTNDIIEADHIIFTCSAGVLKAEAERMFTPQLPEKKLNAIRDIGAVCY
jgi:hypothetical protein